MEFGGTFSRKSKIWHGTPLPLHWVFSISIASASQVLFCEDWFGIFYFLAILMTLFWIFFKCCSVVEKVHFSCQCSTAESRIMFMAIFRKTYVGISSDSTMFGSCGSLNIALNIGSPTQDITISTLFFFSRDLPFLT